jgi:hypothetical protein
MLLSHETTKRSYHLSSSPVLRPDYLYHPMPHVARVTNQCDKAVINLPRLSRLTTMANSDENYNYTYTHLNCSLCRESIDVEDVDSFLAVSSSSGPGGANWMVLQGMRYLCIGRAAASTIQRPDRLPGVYLVHPYCNGIMPSDSLCRRSLFDCIRDLSQNLNETIMPREWPWQKSSTVYAPALRAIISGSAEFGPVKHLDQHRLLFCERIKQRLPLEIFDMILQWLPLELALVLDCVSAKKITLSSLRRLRHDPVASRLERAFHVFGHPKTQLQFGKVEMKQEMVAHFVKIGGQWYLQRLLPNTKQGGAGQNQIVFQHKSNREPYISVQVNEFGITHIAFAINAGKPLWISPNVANKQIKCFQDRGNVKGYHTIFVVSDVSMPREFEQYTG